MKITKLTALTLGLLITMSSFAYGMETDDLETITSSDGRNGSAQRRGGGQFAGSHRGGGIFSDSSGLRKLGGTKGSRTTSAVATEFTLPDTSTEALDKIKGLTSQGDLYFGGAKYSIDDHTTPH